MDLLSHLPSYSPLLHAPSSSPSPKSRVRVSQNLLPIRRKPSQYLPISSQNMQRMEPPTTVRCSCQAGDNGYPKGCRIGEVARVTKETDVQVRLNLDGTGIADSSTGIPFLDHMLDVSSENYESVVNINN